MRVCAAALATALVVLGCCAGVTEGAPVSTFAMVGTAALTGTATDGTPLSIGVHVDQAPSCRPSPRPVRRPRPPAGRSSSWSSCTATRAQAPARASTAFDPIPTVALTLRTASGTVPASASGTPVTGPLSGTYYFAVPPSITTAQIEVGAATVSAAEYPGAIGPDGKQTELTLGPTTIDLALVKTPVTTTPPTSAPTLSPARHAPVTKPTRGLSLPGQIGIGAGSGGVVVLVVVIPIFIRRRRYDRADREGRVIIDSPPVLEHVPPGVAYCAEQRH